MRQAELPSLRPNVKVYCPQDAADYEYKLNGVTGLLGLVRNVGVSFRMPPTTYFRGGFATGEVKWFETLSYRMDGIS